MQLTVEARIANEIILNAYRTLKYVGFDPETQKVIMECVGKALVVSSRQDMAIDERIERVETILYGDTRELVKNILDEK